MTLSRTFKGDYDPLVYGACPKSLTLGSRKFRRYRTLAAAEGWNLLVFAASLDFVLEILFESLATSRVGAAKKAYCSLMCVTGVVTYVGTFIVFLVAVDRLKRERGYSATKIVSAQHDPPFGCGRLKWPSTPLSRSRMSNSAGTFLLSIHLGRVNFRNPNGYGESIQPM